MKYKIYMKILIVLVLLLFFSSCVDENETFISHEEGKILNNNVEPQVYCDAISTETKWCFVNDN